VKWCSFKAVWNGRSGVPPLSCDVEVPADVIMRKISRRGLRPGGMNQPYRLGFLAMGDTQGVALG